jgi:selenocysteine-specific elongation factor
MRVIGTAGHVDHGKSTLIAALTGINPDRLKEEQERAMTIDLGFAWLTLPGGEELGIVDVPGHRDFIGNMLTGVGGLDAVLLVIAADEGVMPQTREHLAILDLLNIHTGIVVLNKIDLIEDPAWFEVVEADIRNTLSGTGLADAPILRVSAHTRQGFAELLETLDRLLADRPLRPDLGRPRLPVDRVFSIAGFGTVVTGTLSDGRLATGEEVELLPSGLRARLRGLQTHKQQEDIAVPGSRTAANLSGVDMDQVRRGDVLVHPGQYRPTQRLDVHFRLLPEAAAPLRHHSEVKVFLGASESLADVRLLGVEVLAPGESAWLQLELHNPLVAVRGDRFILRRPSPGETLGGGAVIDPHPSGRHKRFDPGVLANLQALQRGTPEEVFLQASLALGPALLKDVTARSRLNDEQAAAALEDLIGSGQMLALYDVVLTTRQWARLREDLQTAVSAYHREFPLRRGIPKEELKSRLKLQPRLFHLVVTKLSKDKELVEADKWVALPEHIVDFTPFQQVKVDRLMERFAAAPFATPTIRECQAETDREIYNTLIETAQLVEVSDEVVFRKSDYDGMVERIRQALQARGTISLAEVRDLLGTSRRYVQALLEHMDAAGLTVRQGDVRRWKGKP